MFGQAINARTALSQAARLRAQKFCGLLLALGVACQPRLAPLDPDPSAVEKKPTAAVPALGQLAPGEPPSELPIEADDARSGDAQAPVTLVAFMDYQCSFCGQGFATLQLLRSRYSDQQLRIVFKHLPLDSHDLALPAAISGQAVQLHLGSEAFFEFSAQVFRQRLDLNFEKLAAIAQSVGLSRSAYNEAVSNENTTARIISDVMTSRRIGVSGTPTFFLNGKRLGGAQSVAFFEHEIDAELLAMKALAGSDWRERYVARVQDNMQQSLVDALLEGDADDYLVPVLDSPRTGSEDALVTVVVFSDFECPFCKTAHTTIQQLREKHPEEVRFVFKHLPLPFHPSARPAARLAIVAQREKGDQAFFELSDRLFEASPHLDPDALRRIAAEFQISGSGVEQALGAEGDAIDETIERDQLLAEDVQARGTPHFFINGKRLAGARPLAQFEALIAHERRRATALVSQGLAPGDVYATLQKDALSPGAPTRVAALDEEPEGPSRGPKDAPVVIHSFSDFECPFCKRALPLLASLRQRYPGKLRIVWHDFPLAFHPHALPAARAAREAFVQRGNEGFWKMHDLIFGSDDQPAAVSREQLIEHANTLGLNLKMFEQALEGQAHDAALERDKELAEKWGIRGTPAFVIGNYLQVGAGPERSFARAIELALKEANQTRAK